jgi:hypothetical protein
MKSLLQTCHSLQLYSHHLKAFRNSILGQPTSHLMHKYSNDIVLYYKRKFPVRIYITIFKELITILTGSFLSQYNIIWIFMHEMISWWSMHIHHVIVRQYKSSTKSVFLSICHQKGSTALKCFGTHPPKLPSPHSTFCWKLFNPNLNISSVKILCAGSKQWEYITI